MAVRPGNALRVWNEPAYQESKTVERHQGLNAGRRGRPGGSRLAGKVRDHGPDKSGGAAQLGRHLHCLEQSPQARTGAVGR
ncbi:hypothetical protein NDU88_007597 [Pleurodeles waltl]|uniref:Uncharacterized protein n=1 Tax=Pleurodeles waltl TaxID=8319 RepID=A0AAV7U0A2_PLEWA|nr:hypothetical protein NDU88_007597 [Pleurodeles waltl]